MPEHESPAETLRSIEEHWGSVHVLGTAVCVCLWGGTVAMHVQSCVHTCVCSAFWRQRVTVKSAARWTGGGGGHSLRTGVHIPAAALPNRRTPRVLTSGRAR